MSPSYRVAVQCPRRSEVVVKALRERAARRGRSSGAEHPKILRDVLLVGQRRTSLKVALQSMPDAGDDADFAPQALER